MIKTVRSRMKERKWSDNLSLKMMALLVALILWVIMLGRKDITLSREIQTQVLVPPNMQVSSKVPNKVQVEVSGPRIALKKFSTSQVLYTLNLEGLSAGKHNVILNKDGINLPLGVRLLSLRPKEIQAVIVPIDN